MPTRRAAVVLGSVLALASCGVAEPVAPAAPDPDDEVVLRMEVTDGVARPSNLLVPSVSVYADGRVIHQRELPSGPPGSATLIDLFPGEGHLSDEELAGLLAEAEEAGIGSGADLGTPAGADSTTTTFTLVVDGRSSTTQVRSLSQDATAVLGDTRLTAEQQSARVRLSTFVDQLTRPRNLGQGVYSPTAIAALTRPYTGTPPTLATEVDWPGPALPGQPLLGDFSCTVASGSAAEEVVETAYRAKVLSPWIDGDRSWSVVLRPLLPDETSCADLVY